MDLMFPLIAAAALSTAGQHARFCCCEAICASNEEIDAVMRPATAVSPSDCDAATSERVPVTAPCYRCGSSVRSAVISATTASMRSRSASIDAVASAVAFCNASFNRCSTVVAPSRSRPSLM